MLFPSRYNGSVMIVEHEVWSLCAHHLLPCKLSIDVRYTPKQSSDGSEVTGVLGLSSLPRIINRIVKAGPVIQEEVTQKIVEAVSPYADMVHCIIRGEHLCLSMRGIRSGMKHITDATFNKD